MKLENILKGNVEKPVLKGLFEKYDSEALNEEIKRTQKENKPMKDISRVIVETNEDHPKVLVVITNDSFEMASGLQIREKPVYPDK